jgi:hypothetical protein
MAPTLIHIVTDLLDFKSLGHANTRYTVVNEQQSIRSIGRNESSKMFHFNHQTLSLDPGAYDKAVSRAYPPQHSGNFTTSVDLTSTSHNPTATGSHFNTLRRRNATSLNQNVANLPNGNGNGNGTDVSTTSLPNPTSTSSPSSLPIEIPSPGRDSGLGVIGFCLFVGLVIYLVDRAKRLKKLRQGEGEVELVLVQNSETVVVKEVESSQETATSEGSRTVPENV